jgi:hypothetical protein
MPVVVALLASLFMVVQGAAPRRGYGPGVCGPLDRSQVQTSVETGGQPFPMSPDEIGKMAVIMAESSRSDGTRVLWAGGTAADADGGYEVPIDPSITRVTFSITFDGKGGTVDIAGPDGRAFQAAAKEDDVRLNCGRIVSVDAPVSGTWRVTPRPSERFWAVIHARSERDMLRAEFVHLGGRPGHEGLFRIQGMPIAGRPATLRVRLSEPEKTAPEFVLLSSQGRPLQRVALERVADAEYVGPVELPSVPFRIAMTGVDEAGVPYQRVDGPLQRAETVEVLAGGGDTIAAGRDAPVTFTVRSHGRGGRYRITATAGGEVLTRVEPPFVQLGERSEQRVTVWIPAATIAAARGSIELMAVASSDDAGLTSYNSAMQRLTVVAK